MTDEQTPIIRRPGRIRRLLSALGRNRPMLAKTLRMNEPAARGLDYATSRPFPPAAPRSSEAPGANPLRDYFNAIEEGPGVIKWEHYFDIYHRHLAKFIGRDPKVMEVGVLSGGSLSMWRHYFGPASHLYGVDIEPACKVYEREGVDILIGHQGDRAFWARTRAAVPLLDVFIDDGGHHPELQITTLEEMLPHIRPGGVYVCEDIHGWPNYFASYSSGLASVLTAGKWPLSQHVGSIHHYPAITVIEVADTANAELVPVKRGTEWQPFTDHKLRRAQ